MGRPKKKKKRLSQCQKREAKEKGTRSGIQQPASIAVGQRGNSSCQGRLRLFTLVHQQTKEPLDLILESRVTRL